MGTLRDCWVLLVTLRYFWVLSKYYFELLFWIKWMKEDDVDESGWKWMKMDESGLNELKWIKWMIVDEIR